MITKQQATTELMFHFDNGHRSVPIVSVATSGEIDMTYGFQPQDSYAEDLPVWARGRFIISDGHRTFAAVEDNAWQMIGAQWRSLNATVG